MARKTGSHAQITGPKVQAAALRLFARHGYAAVSMRQIAADVGVQAGALYNYTPDKQSLLFDLLCGHMDALLDQSATQGTPVARLDDFARTHIRFHETRTDAVFISYMELRNLNPENFAKIEGLRGTYEHRLEQVLEDGRAAGVFDFGDTKVTTKAIIAMLTGLTTWYRAGGRLDMDEIEATYIGLVRRMAGVA